ncbi:PAS domain-containing protein [Agrobacterium sp. BA1120]|uniref:PAS domain-containing protein n=1 Tax=Agrobacterium sp. BA1120 TaxID=3228927 RepID=UPI00336A94BD
MVPGFRDRLSGRKQEDHRLVRFDGRRHRQKNAEAALKASEQQLCELINTVPALIWHAGPDGNTTYVNDQLIEWFGLSTGGRDVEWLESLLMDAVHPEEQQDVRATVKRLFATRTSFSLKYRHRRSDGFFPDWAKAFGAEPRSYPHIPGHLRSSSAAASLPGTKRWYIYRHAFVAWYLVRHRGLGPYRSAFHADLKKT